ncbi:universal stress protein [Cryobacterium sp. TMT1-21]|uniref:Universal stress protein n=1 Tax=Cryobacterium shii TaxID=1259235 RepID=A0AAQ2HGX1_9MICO|nr:MULTISPECIES: universal stress protein [Cryobacterium]TFC52576.1 universal stress protein [Cryobacterium shii]TFC82357.1 universal stress protein [Cryobacterium sp. TmT2-59]TFD13930.1 universal stress protein [Cryobacterium sp. TMT4-10]TFD16359.1 universal stress protein [Cryobacterium sp. TMT1-21]TFD27949.1 universal stress protein [Cryobacterium sp. TMT2-23]
MNTYYIGADGSEPSRAAISWGLSRAAEDDSPAVLVNVVDDEWGLLGPSYAQDAERHASALLAEELALAKKAHPRLDIGAIILHGAPSWTLAALPLADDTLIVGTHKTGFLRGRVLGSRSVQIAAAAPCTVAVIPDTTFDTRRGVVVGVDRFEGSTSAVIRGAREADRLGQELILVHAPPTLCTGKASPELPESADAAHLLLSEAAAVASATAPGVVVRRRLVNRDPAEALLDAGAGASLIVVGVSHPRGATQSVIGSVTHDVLMNINVPILIARPA